MMEDNIQINLWGTVRVAVGLIQAALSKVHCGLLSTVVNTQVS
jgi:hypothetical protein